MNTEKQEKHLAALKEKHHALDLQIEEEMSHPAPNELLIQDLKRQKLKIKEEILSLEK
ncbi:MAG: YdcH family protein [Alphaproteobacteria bacterium]|nr:YdcH family protein [Alphaproteobacteria bacterium]MBQ4084409.1 YdcH family protein [Alphaproteobacteria bacterium]